jgi:hypothetical protein
LDAPTRQKVQCFGQKLPNFRIPPDGKAAGAKKTAGPRMKAPLLAFDMFLSRYNMA